MKFDTNNYQKDIIHVHNMLSDLSKSYKTNEKSQQDYICIPSTKKGKKFIKFNVCASSGKDNMLLFLSLQTTGVKMYDNTKKFLYDYSFSQKNHMRIVQINQANGYGIQKKSELNQETNEYELIETEEILPIQHIVDLDDYSDPIINPNLSAHIVTKAMPDKTFHVVVYFKDTKTNTKYDYLQHPELLSIGNTLNQYQPELIASFFAINNILNDTTFIQDVYEFKNIFRDFLKTLPQAPSGTESPKFPQTDSGLEDR